MTRRLPAYVRDKIALDAQKRRHRAEAAPGCTCPYCATADQLHELMQERIRLNRLLGPELPF